MTFRQLRLLTLLLEVSLRERSLGWRRGRSGTDWPTIRPYCGTGGGKRPDARGHALVTHRQGSVRVASASEGARRSEEEEEKLLYRALIVSRISAHTSILTLVSVLQCNSIVIKVFLVHTKHNAQARGRWFNQLSARSISKPNI